ncbi:MAG: phosphate ABC transporter ATP-binding protein PstB [Coriobacteriia bacterium]|nr:phosphate ABC transporter ATP-binding protein PstB [Coriobacteriia bacterium]
MTEDSLVTAPTSLDAQDNSSDAHTDTVGYYKLEDVSVTYGTNTAIAGVSFEIKPKSVVALIGPSGCGKSTILRCLNRMNDELGNVVVGGRIFLDGEDINQPGYDKVYLRQRVGQVFQRPNPFPMSIYDNLAYGPRVQGIHNKSDLDEIVEVCLKRSALWDEVKDNLNLHAFDLSGGQQQRLCIARALATSPRVILMDEPTSALDPISSKQIEETINDLKKYVTVVVVTHNMQQATRVSDKTAFFLRESSDRPSELVEFNDTHELFNNPQDQRTKDYISGVFS